MKSAPLVILAIAVLASTMAQSAPLENWVSSIHSGSAWAVFPCTNYWITKVCGTDKAYEDPGVLPEKISIGDTVEYSDARGKKKRFVVRHIRFFVYDQDVNTTIGGKRTFTKKGETSCTLYDVVAREATDEMEYPSKIVIKGCRIAG